MMMTIIIIKMWRCLTKVMYDDDNDYNQDVEEFHNTQYDDDNYYHQDVEKFDNDYS